MLQPLSGTAPSLGSVTNVMSYLFPYYRSNCFMDLPCHPSFPYSLPIRHPKTELHRSFHPILPPLPVFDRLSTCTRVLSRRTPPPVSVIAVLPPSTCYPGPCWPLQRSAVSPFLPPLTPSDIPPFAALDAVAE